MFMFMLDMYLILYIRNVISDPLVDDCKMYCARKGVHLPGRLSLWLARCRGICCWTIWETWQSAETLSAST